MTQLSANLEFEQIILGSILLENKRIHIVRSLIEESDFYAEMNRYIYRAMNFLQDEKSPIEIASLSEILRKWNKYEDLNAKAYLVDLISGMTPGANVEYYCRELKEKSKLRRLAALGNEIVTRAMDDEDTAEDIIADASKIFVKLNKSSNSYISTGFDSINATFKQIEERHDDPRSVNGMPSGLSALDDITTGFHPGNLVVIAAKTGIGKSALSINIATHCVMVKRKKVLIFSLEMTRQEIGIRMISSETGIDSWNLRTGIRLDGCWKSITKAATDLAECRFWIVDNSVTLPELDSIARRLYEENGGLDLIVVDYLQLVKSGSKRIENRTQEVTEVSRGLKALAFDLKIPVIALSQLNSDGEVRESRAIEQDASLVIMIEMDKDQLKTMDLVPATINVAKNRHGMISSIPCQFRKCLTRFEMGAKQ